MKKIFFLHLSIVLLLSSCASKYNLLSPETSSFSSTNKKDDVEVSYEYLPLRKKYAKKANKTDIKFAAVKVKNNSEKILVYGDNFKLSSSNNGYIEVLSPNDAYDKLRQKPGTHFWYLLLSPLQFQKTKTENGITTTESGFPIGLILGPAISLGNFFTAKGANKKFKNETRKYSILGQTIKPMETKTFLVPLRHSGYPSIAPEIIE